MERGNIHSILTQNSKEEDQSIKEDIVFPAMKVLWQQRKEYKKIHRLRKAIVPKEYKKMVIKNNQVSEELFTIYGQNAKKLKVQT